ncbi:ROK family transcriptional regulator [Devosia elaeis]|uniref:Sugar kinase n=1 Tax=Devosia elaeis TaxID=1770058 RepID=A0A178I4F2_9HYPH|nr:ROK family transcriptional regulator [Devosia elaeis]OAM80139.1 sugar kinase [Devosia elaeis]
MKTADPELMRAINRFHVLDTIRRSGSISRVEIGERTQLSATTISAITASLLDDSLIVTRHEGDLRRDNANRGRPRVMLTLNASAARVVGAKITSSGIFFVVTDFEGVVLAHLSVPVRVSALPLDMLADLVEDGVRRCVLDAGLGLADVTTVALAVPGIVEHGSGRVRSSTILQGNDVPLAAFMSKRLGVATIVESDANAIAKAQHWFGQARQCDDFVLVSLEDSLGLGVMHDGQIFRGARELSLDLGHMMMGVSNAQSLRLADIASEKAILDEENADLRLREAMRVGRGMSHVRRLLEEGNDGFAAAASRAGEALGIAIANLAGLFAPPLVILVGSSLALGRDLIEPLQASFERALTEPLRAVTNIVIDEIGDEAWARGAAAVALSELYGAPWSTTGPAARIT